MNSGVESYLVKIAKEYMKDHPDENIKLVKKITVPVESCDFCSGNANEIVPFSGNSIQVVENKMIVTCFYGHKVCENINFCPRCGRKLNDK